MTFFVILIIITVIVIIARSESHNNEKIDITEMHASGTLNKDGEIIEHFHGTYFRNNQGMGKIAANRVCV